jgi:hypothetical protein
MTNTDEDARLNAYLVAISAVTAVTLAIPGGTQTATLRGPGGGELHHIKLSTRLAIAKACMGVADEDFELAASWKIEALENVNEQLRADLRDVRAERNAALAELRTQAEILAADRAATREHVKHCDRTDW